MDKKNGEKIGVVFDTNAYRNFVKDLTIDQVLENVKKLREKENKAGIKAYSSVIVGLELLGSLVERDDGPNFKDCLKGIIALGIHCFDEEKNDLRIIPNARLLIIESFFSNSGEKEKLVSKVKNVGGVISDIKSNYEDAIKKYKENGTFSKIKDYLISERNDFLCKVKSILNNIKNQTDKNEEKLAIIKNNNFKESISFGIISSMQNNKNNQELENKIDEINKKAKSLYEEFPLSVCFFEYILCKIIKERIDLDSKNTIEKRANWIWDYNIIFLISNKTIDHRKIIIITLDKDMKDILEKNSYGDRVMNLEEYYKFIKYE